MPPWMNKIFGVCMLQTWWLNFGKTNLQRWMFWLGERTVITSAPFVIQSVYILVPWFITVCFRPIDHASMVWSQTTIRCQVWVPSSFDFDYLERKSVAPLDAVSCLLHWTLKTVGRTKYASRPQYFVKNVCVVKPDCRAQTEHSRLMVSW